MNRSIATFGLLAVAAAVVWLAEPFTRAPTRDVPGEEGDSNALSPGPVAPTPLDATTGTASEVGATAMGTPPLPDEPVVEGAAIAGVVLDASTGSPIDGARVEVTRARLDAVLATGVRRPEESAGAQRQDAGPAARSTTGPTGRFVVAWPSAEPADVRVSAPDHLDESRQGVRTDESLRVSLRRGVSIRGHVRRSDGVPIEGARVRADTSPNEAGATTMLSSTGISDAGGEFDVLGLTGVFSTLRVVHPEYMPGAARGMPGGSPIDVSLVPALRIWLRVRSSDGGRCPSPTVQWNRTSSSGAALSAGVLDLSPVALAVSTDVSDAAHAPIDAIGPVKVPALPSDGTVRLTVRAPGRVAWTSEEIAMPAGGGERTVDVVLERDPEAGSLVVRLREPQGAPLTFRAGDVAVTLRRTDGPGRAPEAYVRDDGLVFEGLVAGTWRIVATERRFGATGLDARVEGGRETVADVTLEAGASLRVRSDPMLKRRVHFELLREGATVQAFVDETAKGDAAPKHVTGTNRSLTNFFAGGDGIVLQGLSAGRYVVRVLSPDLLSDDVSIDLVAGKEGDVEIRARPR